MKAFEHISTEIDGIYKVGNIFFSLQISRLFVVGFIESCFNKTLVPMTNPSRYFAAAYLQLHLFWHMLLCFPLLESSR